MFCPSCGFEEGQVNQFCRACGTDLRSVRTALSRPDAVTDSAVSAREEIGRAIAQKIRQTQSAEDLSVVVEEVLPEIEKFLESPEEKRLRRLRNGTVVASIGAGATIAFFIVSLLMGDKGFFIVAGAGFVFFFIGLTMLLNALLFTVPRQALPPDRSTDAESQREIDAETNELVLPEAREVFTSVTEDTTTRLGKKQPSRRR
jgi:hypothetical protein